MTRDEFVERLSKSTQHKYLYHFTDKRNLDSIDRLGLLSKAQMEKHGLRPVAPGGNALSWSLDRSKGIYDTVSLCFTRNHPMQLSCESEGRIANAVYLEISPEAIRIPGTKIAFGIANSNSTEIHDVESGLQKLDFEVIYTRTNWSETSIQKRLKAAEKCELLIPRAVPRELILGGL